MPLHLIQWICRTLLRACVLLPRRPVKFPSWAWVWLSVKHAASCLSFGQRIASKVVRFLGLTGKAARCNSAAARGLKGVGIQARSFWQLARSMSNRLSRCLGALLTSDWLGSNSLFDRVVIGPLHAVPQQSGVQSVKVSAQWLVAGYRPGLVCGKSIRDNLEPSTRW